MKHVVKSILKSAYAKRDPWSRKGRYGRLLIIGGSRRYQGPIFTGLAAYRAGCDLVFMVGPQRPMDAATSFSPHLMTEPLKGDRLEPRHTRTILKMIEEVKATAVVIGPGLWRAEQTRERISLPMVVDADAIRAISVAKGKLYKKDALLTPHSNEFLELAGINVSENVGKRLDVVKGEAHKINCSGGACPITPPVTLLLKGHLDVVSNGINSAVNKTGSPYMTKGGCGDTLAGICGALLARGVDTFTSACAATYINGRSGELAAKEFGEGLLATDLIGKIPAVIKNG
jgi:ADP-dependent NAD(P)H-hydrate dehydratase / NAD(P)H-hydrate epimerase